jgi:phage terminase small subunit
MSEIDNSGKGREIARSPFVNGNLDAMLRRKTEERLTEQDELFVREYLVDLNATQAWIRAGGNPSTADKVGPRKAKHGLVSIAIARALAERSKRVGITADRVLMEIARIALGDPRVLFRPDGSLRAPTEYTEDDAAMIEGIKTRRIVEVGEDGKMQQAEIQEVKLASKIGALTQLGRHLGLFNDKLEVTVNTPLAQSLDAAFKRTGRQRLVVDSTAEEIDAEQEGDAALPPSEEELSLKQMLGLE